MRAVACVSKLPTIITSKTFYCTGSSAIKSTRAHLFCSIQLPFQRLILNIFVAREFVEVYVKQLSFELLNHGF